jgi:hypothetical protein
MMTGYYLVETSILIGVNYHYFVLCDCTRYINEAETLKWSITMSKSLIVASETGGIKPVYIVFGLISTLLPLHI